MDNVTFKVPYVSVIIPVYNTGKYLRKCLDSVINQTNANIEVIIVDDGSPDQAYIIAEEFCKRDTRFTLIRQKNIGLSGARNTGISKAKGKYLLFLDSDDALISDAIDGLFKIAKKEDADIVIPDRYFKIIESTGEKILEYHFSEKEYISSPIQFALKVLIGKGRAWRATSVLYKKEIIDKNRIEFPVGYTAEDIVFNLQLLSVAHEIAFCPLPTLLNLKRPGSITTSFDEKQLKMFLFIDEQVEKFIYNNNIEDELGKRKRYSLMFRNTVVAITGIMSKQNKQSLNDKIQKTKTILQIERISESLKYKPKLIPYFTSKKVVNYFKIMNFLLSNNLNYPAIFVAYIAGRKTIST